MTNRFPTTECDEVMDRLDSFIDGDTDPHCAQRLQAHLRECSACSDEHELALRISDTLGATPLMACPHDVLERAAREIAGVDASRNQREDRRLERAPVRRWRMFALAATVLIILGLSALPSLLAPSDHAFSDAEVAQARQEVEFALALVGDASQRTGSYVRHEVISGAIVGPIEHSFNDNN